jgi:integrase/recombinase XerD
MKHFFWKVSLFQKPGKTGNIMTTLTRTTPRLNNLQTSDYADKPIDIILNMWLHGKSTNTKAMYKRVSTKFITFINIPLVEVRLDDIQEFVDSLSHLAVSTQKTYTVVVKSLLSFIHKLGLTTLNIGTLIKLPKTKDAINERIMNKTDIKTIINNEPNNRNQLILKTIYYLGLRASEICNLKWVDLVLQPNGSATLSVFGKGNKTRFLIVPKPLLTELLTLKKENQTYIFTSRKKAGSLTRTQLWKIVKSAGARVGIDNPSPHWYRHSHATHSLENGADIHLLSNSLGHETIATTSRYLHARPDDCSSLYLDL